MNDTTPEDPLREELAYVSKVMELCTERAVRAALRKGLKRTPERADSMHRHIAALIPDRVPRARERAHYAIAAMLAAANVSSTETSDTARNLGHLLARGVSAGALRERSAETRLRLLTRTSQHGVIVYLPSTVRQIAEVFTDRDWARLLSDVAWWPRSRLLIGKRWNQAFWRERLKPPAKTDTDELAPTR